MIVAHYVGIICPLVSYALNDSGIFDGGLDNDEHSRLIKIPDNSGTWTISVAVATIHSYQFLNEAFSCHEEIS